MKSKIEQWVLKAKAIIPKECSKKLIVQENKGVKACYKLQKEFNQLIKLKSQAPKALKSSQIPPL
jgi:hypothetical protein